MTDERNSWLNELTQKLMHDVYHPFTVCAWLGSDESVLEIYQFDTKFCEPVWIIPEGACGCFLISNHHDGNMRPFAEDMRNWRRVKALIPEAECRLFIYSEDEGLCEMAES